MKPLVVPASTGNGSVVLMGANVLAWGLKQFNIEIPAETAFNLVGLAIIIIMHFTPDNPAPAVAREAVADAAADADMDAAEAKAGRAADKKRSKS